MKNKYINLAKISEDKFRQLLKCFYEDLTATQTTVIESVIYSDGWRGYDGLVDLGYEKHFRVNKGKNEFSKGNGNT